MKLKMPVSGASHYLNDLSLWHSFKPLICSVIESFIKLIWSESGFTKHCCGAQRLHLVSKNWKYCVNV